jgi:predicted MFS family arabinose efflux permease
VRPRSLLLTLGAGLALADASIVTLGLPDILAELDTTVEGVAAVIGVYTIVLAASLLPAERLARRYGPVRVGAAGFVLFAAASVVCAAAGTLAVLLVARGVQAVGGAAGLVAAFTLLIGHVDDVVARRRLWLGAAVLSAAAGPAVGGALTQAFSWQAIFIFQAPVGLLAAAATVAGAGRGRAQPDAATMPVRGAQVPATGAERFTAPPAAALALVSAALTSVLFVVVLLLVAGWSVEPLAAAGVVTVIPAAALAGARLGGDARTRAAAGCALVGLGTIALAFLPNANVAWTFVPQALAGLGMGLALPALGGDLLPERDARDAARLLTIRHVGIAAALLLLAPITADRLDDATFRARERGVALLLDARLPLESKIELAPALLAGVEDEHDPRGGLRRAVEEHRDEFSGAELRAYDHLGKRADETFITAVGEAFKVAFLITAGFALLGAVAVAPRPPWARWAPAAVTAGVVAVGGYAAAHSALAPEPVPIADPCRPRAGPGGGGLGGVIQDSALELLDATACRLGSSREELVLALVDEKDARRFEDRHGVNPRSLAGLIGGLIAGGGGGGG